MPKLNERDLFNRAMAAYFRSASKVGGVPIQPSPPTMVENKGLKYVVLANVRGTLAVYRVRIVNDEPVLKGLKRWPKEVANGFE